LPEGEFQSCGGLRFGDGLLAYIAAAHQTEHANEDQANKHYRRHHQCSASAAAEEQAFANGSAVLLIDLGGVAKGDGWGIHAF